MRRHRVAAFLIALAILAAGCQREDAVVDATTATTSTTTQLAADKEGAEGEFDVTIVFLGLMTFDLTDPKAVSVYLPAIKQPVEVGDKPHDHDIPAHVAYILARKDSFDGSPTLEAPDEGHDVYGYLRVDGETITIPEDQIVPTPLSFNSDGCGECPTSADATRLCWLSSMKKVHGTPQKKSSKYFAPTPDESLIAAKVPITHGTLGTRVIKNGDGQAMVWAFETPGSSGEGKPGQALAQEVHWTFKAKGNQLALNLTPYGSTTSRTVTFKRVNGANMLTIIIGNTTEQDTGPVAVPSSEQEDEHYLIYHRFIENFNGIGPIPVPARRTCKDANALFAATLQPTPNGKLRSATASATGSSTGHAAPGGLNCTPNTWP